METENQSSFILPMPQDFPSGIADEDTVIPFIEDTVTPMTIDASAPGDVIELRDDFDFDGYQVVRREFFAHTFEPSITFNNYKVYVNAACLNKFPHADCVQLLINRESRILALRPCTEFERDAFAWCNTSGGKRKPRQVTGKFFFAKLFELMDWNIDYRYKLLGKVIHANDEYLIAFDLNASPCSKLTWHKFSKGGCAMLMIVFGTGSLLLSVLFHAASLLHLGLPLLYALIVPTLFSGWYYSHYALANGIWYALIVLGLISWILSLVRKIRSVIR